MENKFEENQDSLIIFGAKVVEEQYQGNFGAAMDATIAFYWELQVDGFFC